MLLLKSCPHCLRGDLIVEKDEDGFVADCLQCGYVADEETVQLWRNLAQRTEIKVVNEDRAA